VTEKDDTQDSLASASQDEAVEDRASEKASKASGPPKDRNKRVREQAQAKMQEAKKSAESRAARIGASGLDAGEMVDDALARGFASSLRWVKTHRRAIEGGVLALILGGAGYAVWDWYSTEQAEKASASLAAAVRDELGVVRQPEPDKAASTEEDDREARADPRPKFDTHAALREEALREYRATAAEYRNSGAGILAKLGEAGVLLERRDFDGAIGALDTVLSSKLAKADEEVRMAAKERMGMALEGKGDEAGAIGAYKELESSAARHFKNLGAYHQARISLAKGNKDDAKDKLVKLRESVEEKPEAVKTSPSNDYLRAQVDAMLRSIDPSLAPRAPGAFGSGGDMSMEQIKALQEQLEKMRSAAPPPAPQGETPEAPPTPAPATPQAPKGADAPKPPNAPTGAVRDAPKPAPAAPSAGAP
jgi:hypothetical protein